MPSNEGVVVWVFSSSDERSTEIQGGSKGREILLGVRGEEIKPMQGVGKFSNFLVRKIEIKFFHNLVLVHFVGFFRKLWRQSEFCDFITDFVSCGLDGHTGA